MKLIVEQCANGNTTIVSEWDDNEQGAIMAWHAQARALWGDKSNKIADIKILDEGLNQWGKYEEHIEHPDPDPEPEPEG